MSNTTTYPTTGTYSQDIILQSSDTSGDPATLQADQGVTATITGSITSAPAGSVSATDGGTVEANQPLVIAGPGTIVLANATSTPNAWTGGTFVDAGGTLSIDAFAEIGKGGITLGDASTTGTLLLTNTSTSRTTGQTVTIAAGGGTIDVADAAATDKVSGSIRGPGALTKSGDGTLLLTGSDAAVTTIAAGTLEVGSGGSITRSVVDEAALVFDAAGTSTFAGSMTGSGTVLETGNGTLVLTGRDFVTGGTAIAANSTLQVGDTAMTTAGALRGTVANSGTLSVVDGTLNGAKITNRAGASLAFAGATTATGATISNEGGQVSFADSSSAGSATLAIETGSLNFYDDSQAGASEITAQGSSVSFFGGSSAGTATLGCVNANLAFYDTATAGAATITVGSHAVATFAGSSQAGTATLLIDEGGTADFFDSSSAGDATVTLAADTEIEFVGNSTGGNAAFALGMGAQIDFSESKGLAGNGVVSVRSLAGAGYVYLGSDTLVVGGDDMSTVFTGVISDGGNAGGKGASLVVAAGSSLTLAATNSSTGYAGNIYTGTTRIYGTLNLGEEYAIAASRAVYLLASGAVLDISEAPSTTTVFINNLAGVAGTTLNLGANGLEIYESGKGTKFAGTITDGGSSPGGFVQIAGGLLDLTGTSTYSNFTQVDDGTLELGAVNAAGTGAIGLDGTKLYAAKLKVDAGALSGTGTQLNFANEIEEFSSGRESIDFTSLAYVAGATTATTTNPGFSATIDVSNGTTNISFEVDYSRYSSFYTKSDGRGGTIVYGRAAPATAAAHVDSDWVAMAMSPSGGVVGDGPVAATDPHGVAIYAASDAHAAALGHLIAKVG